MIYNLKKDIKLEKNKKYKQLEEENKRLNEEIKSIREQLEILKNFYIYDLMVIIDNVRCLEKLYDDLTNDYDFVVSREKKILLNRLKQN